MEVFVGLDVGGTQIKGGRAAHGTQQTIHPITTRPCHVIFEPKPT